MKIWTVTYNDDGGARSTVHNTAASADQAARDWLENYWDDYHWLEEHGSMPEDWRDAYEILCREMTAFFDSVSIAEHDVFPPENDLHSLEMIMIENVRSSEGRLEVDSNALVSWGDDPGAYVQTWSWVSFDDVDQPMAIIMPNGTVWCFDLFEEFMTAWSMAPAGARYEPSTDELLEKSEGYNDAWEFEKNLKEKAS